MEQLKKDDKIYYVKKQERKEYLVYADVSSCIVLAPVSDNPNWVDGLILENQKDGKILAVSKNESTLHEWGTTFKFLGECLIKESMQAHNGKGIIYTGTDKYDGKMKVFARIQVDFIGFETN